MTFFVPEQDEGSGLPLLIRLPTGAGERMRAAAQKAKIESDSFDHANQMRRALVAEIAAATGEPKRAADPTGITGAMSIRDVGIPNDIEANDGDIERLTSAVARARRDTPVGRYESLPASPEEFEAELMRRRKAEYDEAETVLGAAPPDAFAAETIGTIAGAVADEGTLYTLPFGGPGLAAGRALGWSLGRTAATAAGIEGTAAAVDEAIRLPRTREVAEDLELGPVNGPARVAGAFAAGAGLGGLLVGGARLLEYRQTRRAGVAETRPEGQSRRDQDAAIARAEEELRAPAAADTPAPEGPPAAGIGSHPALSNPIIRQALDFIGDAEAPKGYNQVYSGIATADRPPRALSEMTIDEVLAWQDSIDRKYQSEAAGRYQFMEDTLRALKGKLGLRGDEVFGQEMQDRLAVELMAEQGLEEFTAGRMSAARFGDNLARVWAGLPQLTGKGRGRSYYAGDGLNAATRSARQWERVLQRPGSYASSGDLFQQEAFGSYSPGGRGYTTTGSITAGDDFRIDVDYEVVDIASLTRASGDLQRRDRSRASSSEQIANMAAGLDPARLMPSPEADRGAPIVGPDGIVESGNGRVAAIERAYSANRDRADAYRQQIVDAGYTIPEGTERPVLVARRKSELSDADRVRFTDLANSSGIARMSASERASLEGSGLSQETIALYRPDRDLNAAENRDFTRAALAGLPLNERTGLVDAKGALNKEGIERLRQAMFARAFDAPDILNRYAETSAGPLGSLIDGLELAAPEWAALRAAVADGRLRPEMDITPFVLDAMRLIAQARSAARAGGSSTAAMIDELLASPDLMSGAVPELVQALVRKLAPGGRATSKEKVAEFLRRYAAEAQKIGEPGDTLLGDAPGPVDALRAIDPETFGDLPDDAGNRLIAATTPELEALPEGAFDEGAASPDAVEGDAMAAEELRAALTAGEQNEQLQALIDAGADPDAIASHPAMRAVLDEMEARPRTDDLPGFGTDEFWTQRQYAAGDVTLLGKDAAGDYLYRSARELAWTEDGLRPQAVLRDRKASILLGAPAAGKSSIANPLARARRATIVDADEAKKIIPEYDGGIGAAAVHEESSALNRQTLMRAILSGDNIVLPKVGGSEASIERLVDDLKSNGYAVDVVLIDVPPAEAWRRMIGRFLATGRLIPPAIMDQGISGPPRTYAALKTKGVADGYAQIDNSPAPGEPRRIVEQDGTEIELDAGRVGRGGGPQLRGRVRGVQEEAADAGRLTADEADGALPSVEELRAGLATGDDIPFEFEDGTSLSATEALDALDQDDILKTVIDGCSIMGGPG